MKKHLAPLLTCTIISIAAPAQAAHIGHALIGLDGGYAWRNMEVKELIGPRMIRKSDDLSDDRWIGGVLVGYQFNADQFFYGLEFNVGWQGYGQEQTISDPLTFNTATARGVGFRAKYERGPVYNLSFRYGYFVTDAIAPYVRVGIEGSEDKLKHLNTYQLANGAIVNPFVVNSRHTSVRYTLGGGLEYKLFEQFSMRMEYNYTSRDGVFFYVPEYATDIHVSPNQHSLKLAAVWNFS